MTDFFVMCMDWVAGFIGSYSWAIILFTIVFRVILSPLDYKTRHDMRKQQAKMAELKPKMDKLEKKYKNDQQKLRQKQQELYQKENFNPFSMFSGCLIPMILQFGLFFIFLGAFRAVSNREMFSMIEHLTHGGEIVTDGWLWVKNIWLPDSASSTIPNMQSMFTTFHAIFNDTPSWATGIVEVFKDAYGSDALNQFAIAYNGLYVNAVGALGSALPIGVNGIGFPILPILAGGSSLLSTFLNPQQQAAAQPADGQQQMNPKTMGIFMAIFSVFICWSNSAAFSLYWLTSNLIATANNLVINKILDYKEKKQKAAAKLAADNEKQ